MIEAIAFALVSVYAALNGLPAEPEVVSVPEPPPEVVSETVVSVPPATPVAPEPTPQSGGGDAPNREAGVAPDEASSGGGGSSPPPELDPYCTSPIGVEVLWDDAGTVILSSRVIYAEGCPT